MQGLNNAENLTQAKGYSFESEGLVSLIAVVLIIINLIQEYFAGS